MAVYVISDTHFGHSNILRYREGFNSIEEHDQIITDNILSVCGKRDSLYILGDVCIYKDAFGYLETIAKNVEFLHICLGNHDFERKGSPTLEDYMSICKSVFGMKAYKNAWLTHAPLHPNELRGKMNVHGHVHANSVDDKRYFNASCENVRYKPVNLAEVLTGTVPWYKLAIKEGTWND